MMKCTGELGKAVLVCTFIAFIMPATTEDKNTQALEALTQGSNKFAIKLYQALIKNSNENLIVSPISLQLVLALTHAGANGLVAEEISKALGFPENEQDILNGHKQLLEELKSPVLTLVNKIFPDKDATIKEEFQQVATEYFNSPAETVDYQDKPEESRAHINKWVEDHTNNKIKNLLSPGSIRPDTRLILANAVHFKANWKIVFDPEDTREESFHVSPTESVPVELMTIRDKYNYTHNEFLKAKLLELPYKGDEFRMICILPDDKDGLHELETKLADVNLAEEFAKMKKETVIVGLPKFKMETTMDLNDVMVELGMSSLFSNPNLSKMSPTPLVVSKVIQKAFIEVNEEGTEAAAATDMMGEGKVYRREAFVTCLHPFMVVVSSVKSNAVIFIGRIGRPEY